MDMSGSNVVRLVTSNPTQGSVNPVQTPPASRKKLRAPAGRSTVHDRYLLNDQQKLADAMALAECGLGLRGVQILTNYPVSFLSNMFDRAGMKAQSGRRKTCLGDQIRNPMLHASLGHFVGTLGALMSRNGAKLDARVFSTALRVHCISTNGTMAQIHPDLLFAAACSYADGTASIKFCTTCRSNYAHFTDPSSLVGGCAYGCPGCRETGAVVGGVGTRARRKTDLTPSSIGDLNIGKPLVRFPSQCPPKQVVQSTLRMLLA